MSDEELWKKIRRAPNPFGEMLGFHYTDLGDGFSRAELEFRPELCNPHEVLHGGVAFTMVDNGMGAALVTTLDDNQFCSTIEIKINFVKPIKEGRVVCDVHVVTKGRTTAVLEAKVTVGEAVVALAQGTYAILERRPGGNA